MNLLYRGEIALLENLYKEHMPGANWIRENKL